MSEQNAAGAAPSPYTADERHVFRYFDGERWLCGDPSPVRRNLVIAAGGKLNELLSDFYGDDAEALAAAGEVLLPAVRESLAMKPFDPATGAGATDGDVEAALYAFIGCLTRGAAGKEDHARTE